MMRLLLLLLFVANTLCAEYKVLAFAGSTRKDSYNKKLIRYAAKLAEEEGATVTVVDLKDYPMPFYDADEEQSRGMPRNAKRLRALMIDSDGIMIATPQYNASVPAVLKNALDWVSRGEKGGSSKEAFKGKRFALMSTSPSQKGGAKAVAHLKVVIEDCGGNVIDQQVSIGNAAKAFGPNGELLDQEAKDKLEKEINLFVSK